MKKIYVKLADIRSLPYFTLRHVENLITIKLDVEIKVQKMSRIYVCQQVVQLAEIERLSYTLRLISTRITNVLSSLIPLLHNGVKHTTDKAHALKL